MVAECKGFGDKELETLTTEPFSGFSLLPLLGSNPAIYSSVNHPNQALIITGNPAQKILGSAEDFLEGAVRMLAALREWFARFGSSTLLKDQMASKT